MVNFKMSRGPNSLMGVAAAPEEKEGSYVSTRVLGSRPVSYTHLTLPTTPYV